MYDLGKQVPLNTIIDKAVEVNADAIGLSALLVSTSKQMPLCVQELHKRGLNIPVLIGGAAINRAFGQRIGFVGDETQRYEPGVYYCSDAFEGLDTMEALTGRARGESSWAQAPEAVIAAEREVPEDELRRRPPPGRHPSAIARRCARTRPFPTPPFWGWRVLKTRSRPTTMFACLDLNSLFRLLVGRARASRASAGTRWCASDFMPRLRAYEARADRSRRVCSPAWSTATIPARAEGEPGRDLTIRPTRRRGERSRASPSPASPTATSLPSAITSRRWQSGRIDVMALQCVTVGDRVSELFQS